MSLKVPVKLLKTLFKAVSPREEHVFVHFFAAQKKGEICCETSVGGSEEGSKELWRGL